MFGSTMLELAIGLTFFYLLLGLICSVVVEFVSSRLNLRAKYLQVGIRTLLKDPLLLEQLYHHPMIESLRIDRDLPPYIPPRSFALAILGLVTRSSSEYGGLNDIRETLYALPEDGATGSLKSVLLIMTDEARGDTDRLRESIELWFISTMDRVSGLYKSRIQVLTFATALMVTIAANVDTIAIARNISETPILRDWLIAHERSSFLPYPSPSVTTPSPTPLAFRPATDSPLVTPTLSDSNSNTSSRVSIYPAAASTPTPTPLTNLEQERRAKESETTMHYVIPPNSTIPIGWSNNFRSFLSGNPIQLFSALLGWLITALAVTLCALFWFDVLNKFMVVRSAIKPFETRRLPSKNDRDGGAASPPYASSP